MTDARDGHGPAENSALPGVSGQEPWRTVYLGQLSSELVPYHPEPPEAPEDELTQAALDDPGDVTLESNANAGAPTFWRLLAVLLVAVVALAVVFWR